MTDLFVLEAPLDDLGTTEAGPAHMQPSAPVSPLTKHLQAAVDEFATSGCDAKRNRNITQELLALGAIRAVYWLALGSNEVALAKEIAEWWAECEPLHGLGETIR
ncbi:hypothetical protein [Aeromonas hydrophila]|uniref:hypothetical protein n=1 Tax=Aeromonas hydrophila TaxID=644 RepID=UPI000A1D7E27|nr:hypothetical protein [Aeromonas hydrophila]OSP49234.1 hypothetical protein B7G55_21250 [Aeromonas hydrophila]GKQ98879.1 hypothetical protein KAM461_31290 [Aeromonas hydrophila]